MSLTLDRMIELVRRGLGNLTETELSDDDIIEYLNMALWEIEADYEFESKHGQYSTALVAGTRSYSITDASISLLLDSIVSVAVVDASEQSHKLTKTTRSWYDEHYNSATDYYGLPTRYLRENRAIILFPTPSSEEAGHSLRITLRQGVPSLISGASASGRLPRQWDEIVVEGAITRGHFYKQDYDLAGATINFQSRKVSKKESEQWKDQRDMGRARLSVIWDEDDLR